MTIPLSPLGAVRRTIAGDDADRFFRLLGIGAARCDLGDQGLYLAEELVAWNPLMTDEDRRAFGVFVLALLLATRQGSTRLPVAPKGAGAQLCDQVLRASGLDRELDARRVLAIVKSQVDSLQGVIGPPPHGEESRPLIHDDGCVYPHRLWWLEDRLAGQLAARAGVELATEVTAAAAVAEVRGALTDEQAAAAVAAARFALAVITGGPGTGKTATLAAIVRALDRLGIDSDDVALAAPTGKAANRMSEALAAALRDGDPALAAAAPRATTLHRLLGFQPGGGFRHGEANPLPARAVIVDEASMIDLALMERLGRALLPDTRLVLIGDPHQLPSVDAGQVLADLLDAAGDAPWAARLTRSFRMDAGTRGGGAVLAAATAVFDGQARRLTATGADRLAVTRLDPGAIAGLGVERLEADLAATARFVDHWWRERRRAVGDLSGREYRRRGGRWVGDDGDALEALLTRHEASRLLTVTRGGDAGAHAWNARCHGHALAELSTTGAPDFLPGEPVLHTRNDYDRGLFNGDQGVIVRVVDDDGDQKWRAVFRRGGELVPFPIDALRGGLELAWALTVHKSQGSELDQIALLLPQDDTPLITRELVYTALTRARHSAILVGPGAILGGGGARKATRSSGLATRLRAALARRG